MVNTISSISEELTRIELNEKEIITPQLRRINRIKTIAGTLEIEGNFIGEEKITAILDGKRVLASKLEILEARGAIAAYQELENYDPDDIDELLKAHKILMTDLLDTAGSFRAVNVKVGNHIAPYFSEVRQLMENLFEWLENSDEHPLIKSCVFHYEFEFIHPFRDGNGRIGRLWQSVILSDWRRVFTTIPTESIVKEYQQSYYKALENATANKECAVFIEFMLEVILKTIRKQILKNKKKSRPKSEPKSEPKSSLKSEPKSSLKIIAMIKTNNLITIKELSKKTKLSTSGIKKIIKVLKDENRLKREGSARKGYWEVVETT